MGIISKEPEPTSWDSLKSEHLLTAHARQLRLQKILGTSDWNVDLTTGRYQIGKHEGALNILGNTSNTSETWMHGRAVVDHNGLDKSLSVRSNTILREGQRTSLDVLTNDLVPYQDADPDELAAVCSSIAGGVPYYQGPTGGGNLVFTLEDVTLDEKLSHAEMPEVIVLAAQLGLIDHRTAITNLLTQEGYTFEGNHGLVTAKRGDDEISLMFDMQGRVTQITI